MSGRIRILPDSVAEEQPIRIRVRRSSSEGYRALPMTPARLGPHTGWSEVGLLQRTTAYHAFFAATLATVPEASTASETLGDIGVAGVAELLRSQQDLLRGLIASGEMPRWDTDSAWGIELRYLVQPSADNPEYGRIVVILLGKGIGPTADDATRRANVLWESLHSQMPSALDFDLERAAGAIEGLLVPFEALSLVEIRRREDFVVEHKQSTYVPVPFQSRNDALMRTLRLLVERKRPAMLSIVLRPTRLTPLEAQATGRLRTELQRLIEPPPHVAHISTAGQTESVKPQLAQLGADLFGRLVATRDRLYALQVYLSSDGGDLRAVAETLGAELSSPTPSEQSTIRGDTALGYALAMPGPSELERARTNLRWQDFDTEWGVTLARIAWQRRLRYLVTAEDAAAAFRVVVATRRSDIPAWLATSKEPFVEPPIMPVVERGVDLGIIHHRGRRTHRSFRIPVDSLNQHALVFGTTRSGKSSTLIHLACELWLRYKIPFLVFDPKPDSRSAYRQLLRASGIGDDLLVFTVGNERVSPFRFNPFELQERVDLTTHQGALLDHFLDALPRSGTLPSIIQAAISDVYRKKRWPRTQFGPPSGLAAPTMREFQRAVEARIKGIPAQDAEDVARWGAIVNMRLRPLIEDSLGSMFTCGEPVPLSTLMERPAVLELYTRWRERALVLMFLLTMVREYCQGRGSQKKLQHMTVVDEINLLFEDSQAVDPEIDINPGPAVVKLLNELTATLAFSGEAIVIAGQSPSVLPEPIIDNTSLKVAHRRAMGGSSAKLEEKMGLDADQLGRVETLSPGQAVTLFQSAGRPYLAHIAVPSAHLDYSGDVPVDDDEVRTVMQTKLERLGIRINTRPSLLEEESPQATPIELSEERSLGEEGIERTRESRIYEFLAEPRFTGCVACECYRDGGQCLYLATVARLRTGTIHTKHLWEVAKHGVEPTTMWEAISTACRAVCKELDVGESTVSRRVSYCFLVSRIGPYLDKPGGRFGYLKAILDEFPDHSGHF